MNICVLCDFATESTEAFAAHCEEHAVSCSFRTYKQQLPVHYYPAAGDDGPSTSNQQNLCDASTSQGTGSAKRSWATAFPSSADQHSHSRIRLRLKPIPNHQIELPTGPPRGKISFNLVRDEIPGRGKFGARIYRARDMFGQKVTVRRLIDAYSPELEQKTNHKISLLHELPENVIRPFCAVGHERDLYIVMESFIDGSIGDLLIETPANWKTILNRTLILRQIVESVKSLQDRKITQKCLSVDSIFVSLSGEKVKVKIDPQLGKVNEGYVKWHDRPYTGPVGFRISGGLELSSPYVTYSNKLYTRTECELNELEIQGKDFYVATQKYTLSKFLDLCMIISTFSKRRMSRLNKEQLDSLDSVSRICLQHPHLARLKLDATPANEIFFLGAILNFVLTGGDNPFWERVEMNLFNRLTRDRNEPIEWRNQMRFRLQVFEDRILYLPLLARMLNWIPEKRPSIEVILQHPVFWDPPKICYYFAEVSDRLQQERKRLQQERKSVRNSPMLIQLERNANRVTRGNWRQFVDEEIIQEHLQYLRKNLYVWQKIDGEVSNGNFFKSVQNLLRLIRNLESHIKDVPEEVQHILKAGLKEQTLTKGNYITQYFTSRFPELLPHVYYGMEKFKTSFDGDFYHKSYNYEWQ